MAHLCLTSDRSLSISSEALRRAGESVPSTSNRQIVFLTGRSVNLGYNSAIVYCRPKKEYTLRRGQRKTLSWSKKKGRLVEVFL